MHSSKFFFEYTKTEHYDQEICPCYRLQFNN